MDGVDGCFHLAAIASVEKGVTDWLGTHRTNITGTITVFDAIRRQGSRIPVVYASSAAVYGDAATVPIAETEPCAPLSAYGADKYWLRTACPRRQPCAWHPHRRPALLQRLRPAPGPEIALFRRDLHLLRAHRRAALPISIFGDGQQTRDFVYVADVVRALLAGMAAAPG